MARGPGTAPLKQSQGEELGGLTQERWEIGLSMLKKKKKGLDINGFGGNPNVPAQHLWGGFPSPSFCQLISLLLSLYRWCGRPVGLGFALCAWGGQPGPYVVTWLAGHTTLSGGPDFSPVWVCCVPSPWGRPRPSLECHTWAVLGTWW